MRAAWRWLGQGGAVLVALATLGGCGSDPSTMSEAVAIELGEQVQQVRASATAGDVDDARARLAEIDTAVEAHRATGEISEEDATRITAATSDVGQSLALLTTSTSTPVPAATAPPATPPPPGQTGAPDDSPADGDDQEDEDDDDDEDDRKGPKGANDRGQGRG